MYIYVDITYKISSQQNHKKERKMQFITSKLKRFDIHRKTIEGIHDQTIAGALVTILSTIIIMFLIYSNISEYFSTEQINHMVPDKSVGLEDIQINFIVDFFHVPCAGY